MEEKQELSPINHSEAWTDAIYACLMGIKGALEQTGTPTQETAGAVLLLAEAVTKLTFG